jgi:hypothetical protein
VSADGGWADLEDDDGTVASAIGQGTADLEAMASVAVVSGTPDEDELAALLAGLATARALAREDSPDDAHSSPGSRGGRVAPWADHARRLGVRRPGASAWRWSGRR